MDTNQVVYVRCTFIRGGFSSERIFVIRFQGGAESRGVAPAHYCFTRDGRPIGDAPASGNTVDGFVPGVIIERLHDGTPRVQLPDGDIYDLDDSLIQPVSTGSKPDVLVKS